MPIVLAPEILEAVLCGVLQDVDRIQFTPPICRYLVAQSEDLRNHITAACLKSNMDPLKADVFGECLPDAILLELAHEPSDY